MQIISKTYKEIEIIFFNNPDKNLYINATKIAKAFKKDIREWKRAKQTIQYMEALSDVGFSHSTLIKVVTGNFNDGREQGTWIHKRLLVAFARWLSPDFAVWCDLQIEEILINDQIQLKDDISELENSLKVTKIASQFLDIFHNKNKLQLLYLDNFVKSETGNSIIEKFGIDLKNQFFLPTELGNFIGKSGMEINQIFANFGFQEKTNGVWKLLERGQEFGSVFQNGSNLQIKWKLSVLEKI